MEHKASLLTDIGTCMLFAAIAGHAARAVRQPAILGYVLAGVLVGHHVGFGWVADGENVELISEIGLVLLLFIIGLEIKLSELAGLGRSVLVLGATQAPLCVALGLLAFAPFHHAGRFDALYLAVSLALSSTLIVVKLLHDKFEVGTVTGRLTLGVLVLQDLWAVVFMAFQPNLLDPQLSSIALSFGRGALLVVAAFLASRWVIGPLMRGAAKTPEMVVLTAMAWCFLLCGLAQAAGLSKEMGALIAGLSIAAFPYGTDVIAKLAGVRDFFVTLFFVSLGLKVPQPTAWLIGSSIALSLFVLVTRLVSVVPAAWVAGTGLRIGLVTALNLAQVSEFALVIVSIGASYQHISTDLQAMVLGSMLVASVLSTYVIQYNDRLARALTPLCARLGLSDQAQGAPPPADGKCERDIVVLGCFREGDSFLEVLAEKSPDLKERVLVVDFNPAVGDRLEARGFSWVYGDLAHPQTLEHLGVDRASVIICSIPDTFLKGTNNRTLLAHLRHLAPHARTVMSAEDQSEAIALLERGAAKVMVPARVAGKGLYVMVREMLTQQAAA